MKSISSVVYRGTAWTFGHDLALDDDIMALKFTMLRETNGEVLKHHLMERLNAEFAGRARPQDVIVAGRRFGHGNPHIPAFIAMNALGVGLVTESMPRGTLRNAVYVGVPVLPFCPGILDHVGQGDAIEVDFERGRVTNVTRGAVREFRPLAPPLVEMLKAGGVKEQVKARIAARSR